TTSMAGAYAWARPPGACYHEFLANLSTKANCIIISVNYRLAPENSLPSAYRDGFNALITWIKHQAQSSSTENKFWLSQMQLVKHVHGQRQRWLKDTILIQPFFGGESRTGSEKYVGQPPNSALTLCASDTYWRLSLPLGANRDHPWCNPLAYINNGSTKLWSSAVMVCVSGTDLLRDRNLEFYNAVVSSGKKVEMVMYKALGHAFQILHTLTFLKLGLRKWCPISRVFSINTTISIRGFTFEDGFV
ncbi:Alpha/beta hydrolase fold, partial [Parasponia andersonii]